MFLHIEYQFCLSERGLVMLKKQTVWLLTMLSLMIVLSVYYLMSDQEDLAYINTHDEGSEVPLDQTVTQNETEDEVENISTLGMSELFATLRLEVEDKRSLKKDRLREIVASSEASANEINEALNEIDAIENIASKEKILQEMILATYENYEDVLVRAEDDKVQVHVITEQLPRNEAVQIMQMVKDELGEMVVSVNFQAK